MVTKLKNINFEENFQYHMKFLWIFTFNFGNQTYTDNAGHAKHQLHTACHAHGICRSMYTLHAGANRAVRPRKFLSCWWFFLPWINIAILCTSGIVRFACAFQGVSFILGRFVCKQKRKWACYMTAHWMAAFTCFFLKWRLKCKNYVRISPKPECKK